MPQRVLIAEDSSVIQNLTRKILEQQNFEITSAKNGKEVLEKIEKEDFNLVLMDINIPMIDGMECTRKIRGMENSEKAKVPIIAITGNAPGYTEEDFKKAGINEFLLKPLDFDKLVKTVLKYAN